jgi:hypothetical protein
MGLMVAFVVVLVNLTVGVICSQVPVYAQKVKREVVLDDSEMERSEKTCYFSSHGER